MAGLLRRDHWTLASRFSLPSGQAAWEEDDGWLRIEKIHFRRNVAERFDWNEDESLLYSMVMKYLC